MPDVAQLYVLLDRFGEFVNVQVNHPPKPFKCRQRADKSPIQTL
jgi:hypothetical protein